MVSLPENKRSCAELLLSRTRRFATAKKADELRPLFLDETSELFWNPDRPSLFVRKFSGKSASDQAWRTARLHMTVGRMIQSERELDSIVELPALREIGQDFLAISRTSPILQVSDLSSDNPDRKKCTDLLQRAAELLKFAARIGQEPVHDSLQRALRKDRQMVFWDPARQKLIIRELKPDATELMSDAYSQILDFGGVEIMIGHRPKLADLPTMKRGGFTHVLSLLSESEGAQRIGQSVRDCGMTWLWLPLQTARPPVGTEREALRKFLVDQVAPLLNPGGGTLLYIHCSAGLHRTAMVSYALLRRIGFNQEEAILLVRQLRPVSAAALGAERMTWADGLVDGASDSKAILTEERYSARAN